MGERFLWGPVQAGWNHQIGHGHTGVKACGQVPRDTPSSQINSGASTYSITRGLSPVPGWVIWQLLGSQVPTLAKRAAQCSAWHSRLVGCPQLSPGLGVGEGTITVWGYFLFAKHSQTAHEV